LQKPTLETTQLPNHLYQIAPIYLLALQARVGAVETLTSWQTMIRGIALMMSCCEELASSGQKLPHNAY